MIEIETDCIKGVIIILLIFFIFILIHICVIFSSLFRILPLVYVFYNISTTIYIMTSINILIFVEMAIHWCIKINGHNKQIIFHDNILSLYVASDDTVASARMVHIHTRAHIARPHLCFYG